jgi:hypothetical protein
MDILWHSNRRSSLPAFRQVPSFGPRAPEQELGLFSVGLVDIRLHFSSLMKIGAIFDPLSTAAIMESGCKFYIPFTLRLYDFFVLFVISLLGWRL